MMNQPLSPKELVTFANQILVRSTYLHPKMMTVEELAMGKHVQWLKLSPMCSCNDIIERAKEIVEESENKTYIL